MAFDTIEIELLIFFNWLINISNRKNYNVKVFGIFMKVLSYRSFILPIFQNMNWLILCSYVEIIFHCLLCFEWLHLDPAQVHRILLSIDTKIRRTSLVSGWCLQNHTLTFPWINIILNIWAFWAGGRVRWDGVDQIILVRRLEFKRKTPRIKHFCNWSERGL